MDLQSRPRLAELLATGIDLLARLALVLTTEHQALRTRDTETINHAVGEKLRLVTMLASASEPLQIWLVEHSHPRNALTQYPSFIDTPQLVRLWGEFLAHLKVCSHKNHINGGVIEVSRVHTERLLGLLRGDPNRTQVYGPTGQIRSEHRLQPLASA